VSCEQLIHLVEAGKLPPLTAAMEWKVPGDESVPRSPRGYVVSFVAFHERGFFFPAGQFIRGGPLRVRPLAAAPKPNNIQQMVVFEVMCEGSWG
jgi:hypothetical protein